jgi:hypothetical protein
VKEIYKMGLKHGMKLAAISGVNGVYSDQDIKKVVKLALKERAKGKKGTAKPPLKKVAKKSAAPLKKASGTAKADVKKAPAKTRRPARAPRESTL